MYSGGPQCKLEIFGPLKSPQWLLYIWLPVPWVNWPISCVWRSHFWLEQSVNSKTPARLSPWLDELSLEKLLEILIHGLIWQKGKYGNYLIHSLHLSMQIKIHPYCSCWWPLFPFLLRFCFEKRKAHCRFWIDWIWRNLNASCDRWRTDDVTSGDMWRCGEKTQRAPGL